MRERRKTGSVPVHGRSTRLRASRKKEPCRMRRAAHQETVAQERTAREGRRKTRGAQPLFRRVKTASGDARKKRDEKEKHRRKRRGGAKAGKAETRKRGKNDKWKGDENGPSTPSLAIADTAEEDTRNARQPTDRPSSPLSVLTFHATPGLPGLPDWCVPEP